MSNTHMWLLTFLDSKVCKECPYELNDEDCQKCGCKANRDTIMNAIVFYEKFKIHRDADDFPDTTRIVIAYQKVSEYLSPTKILSIPGAICRNKKWYYPETEYEIQNVIAWREMIRYDDR